MDFLEVLTDHLSTFTEATGIQLQLLDQKGKTLKCFGDTYEFCRLFEQATGKYCPCMQTHIHSCSLAEGLGESYIFACPAELIHFTVPVYKNSKHVGSVLAGPISLEYPDMHFVDTVIQKYGVSLDFRSRLYSSLGAVPLVEPYRARHLSQLLFLMVANLYEGSRSYVDERSSKAMQQAQIGEHMQSLKRNPSVSVSQYQLEKDLVSNVLLGDVEHAKSILNEMLGRIYFASGNNLDIIKTRTIELLAVLSRAVAERDDSESVFDLAGGYLHKISAADDLTDLSFILLGTLEEFTASAFPRMSTGNQPLINRAIKYIGQHYSDRIHLEEVADYVGLNATYFSTLFRRETGITFSNYVIKLRVEQAKRLLRDTNLSLVEIALSLGFENQSYFSNVFKKHIGVSPKQYRQSLT